LIKLYIPIIEAMMIKANRRSMISLCFGQVFYTTRLRRLAYPSTKGEGGRVAQSGDGHSTFEKSPLQQGSVLILENITKHMTTLFHTSVL
jgi:hypothetical protein